jgi:integrase-like protein
VPSGRPVADAFLKAMRVYGVSSEVLTDNGKQFTGRFTKPRPAEVLFERVCRENGITARLIKPYSPTTTGKIERWHQTLRRELLDPTDPFVDLPRRPRSRPGCTPTTTPHQSLDMATPASLFRPNANLIPWSSPRSQAPREIRTRRTRSRRTPAARTAGWCCCPQPVRSSSTPSSPASAAPARSGGPGG